MTKPKRHRWLLDENHRGNSVTITDRCLDCGLLRVYDKLELERCYFLGSERFNHAGPCAPREASAAAPTLPIGEMTFSEVTIDSGDQSGGVHE